MKRGLVIGKFMPIHAGHVGLIDFAARRCDELIVSMSFTPDDPIPYQKRFGWIEKLFNDQPNIKPRLIADDFDNPHLPLDVRTKGWAEVLRKVYPKIDFVFSSEPYGEFLAKHLGAAHLPFDPDRRLFPVSATAIRQKPLAHWDFIPRIVQPYFVKKICFYGAESTGKSTMAQSMAKRYNTVFVPEVAREMITTNDFTADDIIRIGHAHYERILAASEHANKLLFCDTDAITTQIYSKHYLTLIPPVLFELESKMKYDKYFLFDIDVPWVADGLRDLGNAREEMHEIFKHELEKRKIDYTLVTGSWHEREQIIVNELEKFF